MLIIRNLNLISVQSWTYLVVRAELEAASCGCGIRRPNHSAMLRLSRCSFWISVVFTHDKESENCVLQTAVLFQELPNNGVMLVYVSGDGCPGNAKAGEEGTWGQRSNHYFISVIFLFNNAFLSP